MYKVFLIVIIFLFSLLFASKDTPVISFKGYYSPPGKLRVNVSNSNLPDLELMPSMILIWGQVLFWPLN